MIKCVYNSLNILKYLSLGGCTNGAAINPRNTNQNFLQYIPQWALLLIELSLNSSSKVFLLIKIEFMQKLPSIMFGRNWFIEK